MESPSWQQHALLLLTRNLISNDYDIGETIDDLAYDVEDIQDTIDDVQDDDVDIELDNNIANHYIAECDNCHGVFISSSCRI